MEFFAMIVNDLQLLTQILAVNQVRSKAPSQITFLLFTLVVSATATAVLILFVYKIEHSEYFRINGLACNFDLSYFEATVVCKLFPARIQYYFYFFDSFSPSVCFCFYLFLSLLFPPLSGKLPLGQSPLVNSPPPRVRLGLDNLSEENLVKGNSRGGIDQGKIFLVPIPLFPMDYSTALRCGPFSEKIIEKEHLCYHDKNYYQIWKSNIFVINLIVDSRNMTKV